MLKIMPPFEKAIPWELTLPLFNHKISIPSLHLAVRVVAALLPPISRWSMAVNSYHCLS